MHILPFRKILYIYIYIYIYFLLYFADFLALYNRNIFLFSFFDIDYKNVKFSLKFAFFGI